MRVRPELTATVRPFSSSILGRAAVKVLRGDGARRTRFHTESGQLLPLAGWSHIPACLWHRLAGQAKVTPWIVPSAVKELERILNPSSSVFEFGAGASSAWFAKRAANVVSLEHDSNWCVAVREQLRAAGLRNCELRLVDVDEFPDAICSFADESFDVVLVDGEETSPGDRLACLEASRKKVKPGGYLVLDDSDRPAYQDADKLLPGWDAKHFIGLKLVPLAVVQTTIYRRPSREG